MDTFADDVKSNKWICCQIGAREHYVIPAELQTAGQLELMITDFWARPGSVIANSFAKDLQGRRHSGIPDDKVKSFNLSSLSFEVVHKLSNSKSWELVMKRNQWFQKKTINYLKSSPSHPSNLFSYSYAARDIFKYAKSRGWMTVLGQIDPGPLEEEIVINELQRFPDYKSEWQPAPGAYWENWYKECELADKIVVNSEWSYKALTQKGINKNKLQIVPLSYSVPKEAELFKRSFPTQFDQSRPLRVLFLGQVILRKGIARIIEAARLLRNAPIEFIITGPIGIRPLPQLPNVKWIGRIPRLDANKYFKDSDIFLFPTLSDGFGLTQLEALAWRLPVIASPYCGRVIKNEVNGFVINDLEAETIASVLMEIIMNPKKLSLPMSIQPGEDEETISKF